MFTCDVYHMQQYMYVHVHMQHTFYTMMSVIAGTVREMLGLHAYEMVEVNPTQHSDYLVLYVILLYYL